MAQVVAVSVYKLGAGNVLSGPTTRAIPVPFEALAVPASAQPEHSSERKKVTVWVYSKIRFGIGATGITEELYSGQTVDQLVTAQNA